MSLDRTLTKILIIDFGSQFTQLIARRIRELGVYSEIISHKQIKYLRKKPQFVKITKAGFYESMVHNVDIVKNDSKY